ncbi:hypothetical protein GC170_14715 [bacterium]|nr:hypothetical protein [bacterium]
MLLTAEVSGVSISTFLGNSPPRVLATVKDSAGLAQVTGAEYFIDTMPDASVRGKPMSATDGAFDQTSEAAFAKLTAADAAAISEGTHTLYVRGFTQGGVGAFTALVFVKDTVNDAPTFSNFDTTPHVLRTRSVSVSAAATDPDSTVLTYSLSGAPAWASIDSASGLLSLSPGFEVAAGDYSFDVVVKDNGFKGKGIDPKQSVLTVNATVHSAGMVGDDLVVLGTVGDDEIEVETDGQTVVKVGGVVQPIVLGLVAESDDAAGVAIPAGGKILVTAGEGRNYVRIAGAVAASVTGGSGADHFRGGDGDDVLVGFDGADVLDGGGGDDTVIGDGGDDWLVGGTGVNLVRGGSGDDRLIQTGTGSFDLATSAYRSPGTSLAALLAGAPSGDADYELYASQLLAFAGVVRIVRVDMPDQDVEFADLVGGDGNNRFSLDGWAGDGTMAARGGFDTLALKGTSGVVDVITITDTELTFGPVHFLISGFENLETDGITGEDTINVSGALMRSYTNKGSDADIRINLTGANFESLFNYGNQTNIKIDISGADFGSFTSLVNTGSGVKIDITGAIFESLVNMGADTSISIDLTGADFTAFQSLSNEGDNVRIDVTGADFGVISNSGKDVIIDLSGADFGSLTNLGDGAKIDVGGADFTTLLNQGGGTTIDISGADFTTLLNQGGGTTIDINGADFTTLINLGDGTTIHLGGADFESLTNEGGGTTIDVNGAAFGSLTNLGDGTTIDIDGADFDSLTNQGGGTTIDIHGADFGSLTNQGDGVTIKIDPTGADFGSFDTLRNFGDSVAIDVSGASFDILLNTGDEVTIDVSGAAFGTLLSVTVEQFDAIVGGADFGSILGAGGLKVNIDVSGADFGSLVTGGDGSTIDVSGADFTTLVNLGSGVEIDASGANFDKLIGQDPAIDLSGANFGTLANYGDGVAIDVSGAVFSVIVNYGDSALIDAGTSTGADFSGLTGPDPSLDLSGAHFGVLVNYGDGAEIDATGADFGSLNNGGSGVVIDVSGADFGSLNNGGSGVVIDVSGADFGSLNNGGSGVGIDVSGADFGSLTNTGSGVDIDATGADFGSLNNGGSGVVIDVSGADFGSLSNGSGGDGVTIDASGADFGSLTSYGDGVTIDAGGAVFDLFAIYGDGSQHIFVQGGPESNTVILAGTNLWGVVIETGGGGDVFVLMATQSGISVNGQGGDDRFVIGVSTGSMLAIDGGGGNDQFLFSGDVQAAILLTEAPDADVDTLDFSSFTGGPVSIDLASTANQAVAAGLSITLSSGLGIENVIGTDKADTILGNLRNNDLRGTDLLDDRMGPGVAWNGRTQIVVLDFDTFTNDDSPGLSVPLPGVSDNPSVEERVYSDAERASILAGIQAIYAGFLSSNGGFLEFRTTADGLAPGTFATVYFNRSRFSQPNDPQPGGDSSQVDFRNVNADGWATVQINGLLGGVGQPEASSQNFVTSSVWMAAHELGHLLGLRHSDSFGPIGFGINAPPGLDRYAPAYPGPAAGFETNHHVMATPAATGFTLEDLVSSTWFGERELVKLAYARSVPDSPGVNGLLVEESASSAVGQEIDLVAIDIPQAMPGGLNAPKQLAAAATTVLGYISAAGQKDLYTFSGRAGDLMNLEVFSRGILADRYADTLDTVVRVLKDGIVVAQFEGSAVNDDQFEFDSAIVDLYLPEDGNYTIEVSAFSGEGGVSAENETGHYELFVYRIDTANRTDGGDVLEGRGGDDVLAGGEGDDRYVFTGGNLGTDLILEDSRLEALGLSDTGRDLRDVLDFSGLGGIANVDLASNSVQVVAAGILNLRLSSSLGIEDVRMGASGGTALGNARDNTFFDGAGSDSFDGRSGNDVFELSGGSDQVSGGEGADIVRYVSNAAGSVVATGGSGMDTLDFSARTTGVTVNLGVVSPQAVGGGLSLKIPLLDWENATGSAIAANSLVGNGQNNVLIGGSARDTISGGAGDDVLIGLDGDDALTGDEGFDILIGGRGADSLIGSNGEDLLISGRTIHDAIEYDAGGANVNLAYFDAVLAVWKNGMTVKSRRDILRNLSTGLLRDGIVIDDASIDVLRGSAGDDLVLVGNGDQVILERSNIPSGDIQDRIQP